LELLHQLPVLFLGVNLSLLDARQPAFVVERESDQREQDGNELQPVEM